MMEAWLPGSLARVERARQALPVVLDSWLEIDGLPLNWLRGPQPAVASESASVRLPTALREAAEAAARFSQAMRTGHRGRDDGLPLLADNAARAIDRLAAWVIVDLGLPVDREAVLAEADAHLQEVEAEDNGLLHATDAITGVLQAQPDGAEQPLSERELTRHGAKILAPLLAQAACLRWGEDGA